MKRMLALLLAYVIYLGTFPAYADTLIIGPDVSSDDVKYTSSMEVYLPESIMPKGIAEMDSAIRSVGSVDAFVTAVDEAKATGVYEVKNEALSRVIIKTKNFLPKRPLKENPWFTRKPKGKDVETEIDIHIDEYDARFITNPMHHSKYRYFNLEAYQDYKDWLTFVNWDGKLGEGYGFAYIDKYGFTHVVEDFRTAMVYSADGNLYVYEGEYSGGVATDSRGNRYYLKSIPNSVNFGNYGGDTDRIYGDDLRKFDESKYTEKVDPENYVIEWESAEFGYDSNGDPIVMTDTFPNQPKNDGKPIVPEYNSTPSAQVSERSERPVREDRPTRSDTVEDSGTIIVPSN